jgi:hypothetical protein
MSVQSGSYKIANADSKSKAIIKYALYIILSGMIAFYMKDSIDVWAEEMQIPFRGDLLVTMIGITLGMVISTVLLYFYDRSAGKKQRVMI